MKIIRRNVFETNSSSTHSLIYVGPKSSEDYMAKNPTILVQFIDTDDWRILSSLEEKVSYLVSHIVNNYKYNCATYNDLVEQVTSDWDFKRLDNYVQEHFNKRIVFPEKYEYDLEDIVSINHQLIESNFDNLLEDIMIDHHDYLEDILSSEYVIEIGND